AFTTLSANSTVTLTGLTTATGNALCISGANVVGTCTGGGGLQTAYGLGNTIDTTTARNIVFTLSDVANPTSFILNNNATASAFIINDTNAATNNSLVLQSNGVTTLTANENGVIAVNGGATADITTLTEGNSLTIQPITQTIASGTGGALVLSAANATGLTSVGGGVTIDAGNGTAANGAITIGGTNASSLTIG